MLTKPKLLETLTEEVDKKCSNRERMIKYGIYFSSMYKRMSDIKLIDEKFMQF